MPQLVHRPYQQRTNSPARPPGIRCSHSLRTNQIFQSCSCHQTHTQPPSTTPQADCSYRSCAASSVESDFLPGDDEDPDGRERGHVFEVLADVFGGSPQQLGVRALSVVDFSSDAIVHVCPERCNEGPSVCQGKGLWCELADERVEGNHTVVVDLHKEIHLHFCKPLRVAESCCFIRKREVSNFWQKMAYNDDSWWDSQTVLAEIQLHPTSSGQRLRAESPSWDKILRSLQNRAPMDNTGEGPFRVGQHPAQLGPCLRSQGLPSLRRAALQH